MAARKIRDYQRRGADFIIDTPRCNLWADMGLGKTVTVLTALDLLWLCGSRFHPALVIAPLRVARDVWAPEARVWPHLRYIKVEPIVGSSKQRAAALKRKADVYTCNYENIPWLVDKLNGDWPFKYVIADESPRLKSFRLRRGGKRAAALSVVASKTGRWVNMTGTPSPNGLIDLWGQNWFVDHGQRLGLTYSAFKDRWFDENPYTKVITPKANAEGDITELLSDVTLSLRASDYFDLPPIIFNTVGVTLPFKAREMYRDMERKKEIELEGVLIEALSAMAKSQKLLQMASGAIYKVKNSHDWAPVHEEKIEALRSIFTEQAGAPLIVVYQWVSDLIRIKRAFPKARMLDTKKDYNDWNAGKIPMLLVHPQSAGHGLNMQEGGNAVAFFSHWWNLEEYQQVIDRIGPVRQMQSGLNRPTIVHNIVALDTVDEDVIARRITKASVQDALRAGISRRRNK